MNIDIHRFNIDGPVLITPKRFDDARGFFSETYNGEDFAKAGITSTFVQDNHSLTAERGTVRGLHFQAPPRAQDKLVRVTRGSMLDVIVDIRRGSPTYGQHLSTELNEDNWCQIFIPKGFAHGFCTLTPDTEVLYKTSDYWAPEAEGGIRWNDPDLKIAWPDFAGSNLSTKDREHPWWAAFESPFSL